MKNLYQEIGKQLKGVFDEFAEGESDISTALQISVINEVNDDTLLYGLSFFYIHDAYYLIGSCSGGGMEFIEWIDNPRNTDDLDEELAQMIEENLKKMSLKVSNIF